MDLRFLGVGAAFNPAMGNTNAFFTRGDDLYFIDCGEQAFAKIMHADLFTRYPGRITVLLTHLHGDHAGGLGTLCLYADAVLGRKVTIVHPNDDVRTLLQLMGASPPQYVLLPALETGGLTVTPEPTRHSPGVPSFSLWMQSRQGRYFYSGDTAEISQRMLDGLADGSLTRAWQEVSRYGAPPARRPPHVLYEDLLAAAAKPLRGRITVMHFNTDFTAIAEADGFVAARVDPIFA